MKNTIAAMAVAVTLFCACSKYNTNISELPSWSADWLLPLVKGKVSFENIRELSDSKISFNVPSMQIGYAAGSYTSIPPFTVASIGPYKQPLSDWIHFVYFDTLQIALSFQNTFPVPIGAGTRFSFRRSNDTNDPNNLIYKYDIPVDIAPNETYSFDIKVLDNFLTDTVYLFLEQFKSPGGNNVVFTNLPSRIDLQVKIIDISRAELFSGKSEAEIDTVDIDFSNEDTGTDTASYGKVNFYVDNAIPINFFIQVYFLDAVSSQITDSLLDNPFISNGCNTNAAGDPVNINSNKTTISVTTSRIQKIKQSKRAIVSYKINTLGYPPPYVVLNDKTYLKLQVTGDLHLSFNLNSL